MSSINETLTFGGLSYYHTQLEKYLTNIRSVVSCKTDMERLAIVSPNSDTLYIVLSPMSIYIYDNGWCSFNTQEVISDDYIDSLFTIDEVGELTNNIEPIASNVIDNIWNSV